MQSTGIKETLDQFDASFGRATAADGLDSQEILDWAKASAARDPEYVKHICDRYRQRMNEERLERANAVGKRKAK